MKKSFLGFMLISLMGLALSQKALASTDPASSWEHLEKQREQQQREQDAREQRARLIQARARHIAEALELTETETGEPASAFTYKCYQGEGVLSDCKAQDAGVIQYYRTILLQSRNKMGAALLGRRLFDQF